MMIIKNFNYYFKDLYCSLNYLEMVLVNVCPGKHYLGQFKSTLTTLQSRLLSFLLLLLLLLTIADNFLGNTFYSVLNSILFVRCLHGHYKIMCIKVYYI